MHPNINRTLKWAIFVASPVLWYNLGKSDKNSVKQKMFYNGLVISQYFKQHPSWDKYAEPLLVKQFSILFTAGYSFLNGMMSDNDDKHSVKRVMDQLKNEIISELETNQNPNQNPNPDPNPTV